MDVLLKCQDCGYVTRMSARTADWPPCRSCGSVELRLDGLISLMAPERVERTGDDDLWKASLDEYLTNDRRRV